ncbi:hypothetical protein ALC57_15415 [Trachymyrmex cornetzi]|uniref:Endonuclease/exonuclease/phosphatase domain-containing protein n=1 Tax=Trachymyrmex cornetzi TaxID=471704 RepID=A0A151IX84_9HYME|nr:hypothetical protein ALC57_15415 [Trachymyrmex cornetzi]
MAFWNVLGLGNKDRDFWDRLKGWDAKVLMETWVEEKRGKYLKEKLPEDYVWRVQEAKRKNKKERPMRGMLMGIRKELYMGEEGRKEEEGLMTGMLKVERNVYINMDMKRKLESLAEWMEGKEEGIKTMMGGGDFNVRTRREGGRIREEIEGEEEEKRRRKRRSRDSKKNKVGGKMVEFIRERSWSILNGDVKGDKEGNWTYTGRRGVSVIDYVLTDEETREGIEYLVEDEMDSDHRLLVVTWKGGREKGKGKGKEGGRASRGVWNEESRVIFRERLSGVEWREGKGMEWMECMKDTEGRIREILEVIEKKRDKERKVRG